MQRFFSTFPNEWPGAGLLLLRLTLAGALFADAAAALNGTAAQVIARGGEILTGALLAIGLWTPIAGIYTNPDSPFFTGVAYDRIGRYFKVGVRFAL